MIEYTVKVFSNGTRKWYHNGLLHREDGPSVEYADGTQHWMERGQLHRYLKPAVTNPIKDPLGVYDRYYCRGTRL